MREITIYNLLPVYAVGSNENTVNLKNKLEEDVSLLNEICRDYENAPSLYRTEYLNALKNYKINEHLYAYSYLSMHQGKALIQYAYSDYPSN